jgi:acetylornithine deacetylase/succinyl-diaminopimelate desuccinylase-like protein
LTERELDRLRAAAAGRVEAVASLAKLICETPAPTGEERARAELVASLLAGRAYTLEIDGLGNVYVRRRGRLGTAAPVLMLLAHTDTVFPATTPIVVRRDGDLLHGSGIGDNSVGVAAMISLLDLLDELALETEADIVAVADVGEEGLGNLRGARAAVERYLGELGAVIVIDGCLGGITHVAVGSRRWRITVRGPGGHAYGDFGTPSAIHGLGRIIAAIAGLEVARDPKTTYNVGTIEGGTSVNTIAPSAAALVDLRSTDAASLDRLAERVREIVERCPGDGLTSETEMVGERPAGSRDRSDPLVRLAAECLAWVGGEPSYRAASTDANIPISLGIPSVCVGVTRGEHAHTDRELIEVPPIAHGLAQLSRLCLEATALVASGTLRRTVQDPAE